MAVQTSDEPALRLGVLGGRRGWGLTQAAQRLGGTAEVVAMCDVSGEVRDRWSSELPGVRTYSDEAALIEDCEVDAIIVATPIPQHAAQAIACLEAGKHVLSEILACASIEQGQALINTVDRTGLTYMMAENSCYTRTNLAVRRLAEEGRFGQVSYLRGGYLHDVRNLTHHPDGSLTWRGQGRARLANLSYPTHAMGPLMHWLQAANGAADRPVSLMAATSSSPAIADYFRQEFGSDHPGARPEYWRAGDTGSLLITTTSGAIIDIRVDLGSPRPHSSHTTYHELQGSKGLFLGSRGSGDPSLVWFEPTGRTESSEFSDDADEGYLRLDDIIAEHDHPLWQSWFGNEDVAQGHQGGDFFVVERFVAAVRGTEPVPIDVRTAVMWSAVPELSARSIAEGGAAVSFPLIDQR